MRVLLALNFLVVVGCARTDDNLQVYAAASLRDVGAALVVGHDVTLNFAGSQTLAQQIRAARDADVFLSADERWVDTLIEEGLADASTKRAFAANELVLVARRDARFALRSAADLPEAPFTRLCVGMPDAVPAGRYTRAALERLRDAHGRSVWERVLPRVAPAVDVRAALQMTRTDPRHIGAVYRSDLTGRDDVVELVNLDARARYFAVLLSNDERGPRFLDDLFSPRMRVALAEHGFLTETPGAR